VDASAEIGVGHVMRCLALGQALCDKGCKVVVCTKTENEALLERLRGEGFELSSLRRDMSLEEDAEQTAALAEKEKVEWVVTDGYAFTTDYQRWIREKGFRLLCIDDVAACHYVSDAILNQNHDAEKVFRYSCEAYTRLLLGSGYALLRREFRSCGAEIERVISKTCEKIVVTLGGGDRENHTLKILRSLEKIEEPVSIKVVLGAVFSQGRQIEEFAENARMSVEIMRDPEDMASVMDGADLVIASAGTTVWELVALKVPMMIGIAADNQKTIAQRMEKSGAAKAVGWWKEISEEELADCVRELLTFDARKALSVACAPLSVELNMGAERVVSALLSMG